MFVNDRASSMVGNCAGGLDAMTLTLFMLNDCDVETINDYRFF